MISKAPAEYIAKKLFVTNYAYPHETALFTLLVSQHSQVVFAFRIFIAFV